MSRESEIEKAAKMSEPREIIFCPWCKRISKKMSQNGYCQRCFEAKLDTLVEKSEIERLKQHLKSCQEREAKLVEALNRIALDECYCDTHEGVFGMCSAHEALAEHKKAQE